MSKTWELTHLFRALKAPAAARALPSLAERARADEWSHERFLEAVLSSEVSSRESHGGEARIKAARFPARKSLEEFDFSFQRSVKRTVVEHLGQLDFLHGRENEKDPDIQIAKSRIGPRRIEALEDSPARPAWAAPALTARGRDYILDVAGLYWGTHRMLHAVLADAQQRRGAERLASSIGF